MTTQDRIENLKNKRSALRKERRVLTTKIGSISQQIQKLKRTAAKRSKRSRKTSLLKPSLDQLHLEVAAELERAGVLYHDRTLYCPRGKFFGLTGMTSAETTCREGTRRWYQQIRTLIGTICEPLSQQRA